VSVKIIRHDKLLRHERGRDRPEPGVSRGRTGYFGPGDGMVAVASVGAMKLRVIAVAGPEGGHRPVVPLGSGRSQPAGDRPEGGGSGP
jgi:hypothetical protein